MIATTMEKMNADCDLPAMQVLKFDGSPENYLVFRLSFHQMVDSKVLDEPTKMAHLIQFLDGPALLAVQRYESVPGGLTKALQVLQDRFGQLLSGASISRRPHQRSCHSASRQT